jgi:citronellyl-CoA synthetase
MLVSFKKCLPAYAVPVFLRVQKQVETTGTFKYQKNKLKEQAFDPKKTDERLLVLLPNSSAYTDLTQQTTT